MPEHQLEVFGIDRELDMSRMLNSTIHVRRSLPRTIGGAGGGCEVAKMLPVETMPQEPVDDTRQDPSVAGPPALELAFVVTRRPSLRDVE